MENNKKKMKKGVMAMIIAAVLVAVVASVILLSGGDAGIQLGKSGNIVELPYGFSIRFPKEYAKMVEHTQEQYGDRITEAFVLKDGEVDISLYYICFGDRENGDWLGELNIDGINVPVTYTIFSPDEEDLAKLGEEGMAVYDALRESFGDLLNAITKDQRYVVKEEPVELVLGQEVEMTYWNVILPEAITFEETNQDGIYQADFFGVVAEERVKLYSVRIGGDSLFSPLGLFEIDGERKIVSVEVYSQEERTDWEQDDFANAYLMMDTINNVIEQIMSSEHYSEE